MPAFAAQHRVELVRHVAQFRHQRLHAAPEHVRQFGRNDAAIGPFEQRGAHEFFKFENRFRDAGLRQVQLIGGA
ncbi:Uncharacterised protein [Mycobacteroides abscessus subsp. abscessus]|nr:Uncharacterised protein [Mycobacteroides abscessus subsp. abscessus]